MKLQEGNQSCIFNRKSVKCTPEIEKKYQDEIPAGRDSWSYRGKIKPLALIYGEVCQRMAPCNLHHLYYWWMRSRAALLTAGSLPAPLFTLQSAWEALSSHHRLPSPGLGDTCQHMPKSLPGWHRGANSSLSASKCVQGLSPMVPGLLLELKDPSPRSKESGLDPSISVFTSMKHSVTKLWAVLGGGGCVFNQTS